MADRKLVVEIIGDDSQFQQALSRSTASLDKFGRDVANTQGRGANTPARTGGVNTVNTPGTQDFLRGIDEQKRKAEELRQQIEDIGDEALTSGDKFVRAAKIGAGFFALGRGLKGAGAALEVIAGESTSASDALNDAGGAIESIITLDPEGFFKAVGGAAERSRQHFDNYAQAVDDVNTAHHDLEVARAARALGMDKEAQAIEDAVDRVAAAAVAFNAIEFANRNVNVTTVDGKTFVVTFKGASAAEDVSGKNGLGGAGGVDINRNSRQGPTTVNTTVEIDGQKVGQAVTQVQQGQARSNPRQKRGGGAANSPDSR